MHRKLVWSKAAHADLSRLRTWIEEFSYEKALTEANRILTVTQNLLIHSRLGKRITIPNIRENMEVRELLTAPYVIRYSIQDSNIYIVRIWHYREDRPFHTLFH